MVLETRAELQRLHKADVMQDNLNAHFLAERDAALTTLAEAKAQTEVGREYAQRADDNRAWALAAEAKLAKVREYTANNCSKRPADPSIAWTERDRAHMAGFATACDCVLAILDAGETNATPRTLTREVVLVQTHTGAYYVVDAKRRETKKTHRRISLAAATFVLPPAKKRPPTDAEIVARLREALDKSDSYGDEADLHAILNDEVTIDD